MMQKFIRKSTILVIAIILLGITLGACSGSEPELDIDAQKTGFAQTANVQASQTVEARPTATETPIPLPTFTPTVTGTSAPILTPTESNGAGQPPSTGTDAAAWLANDPPDNTKFAPGEAFTVTWTIENVGTSTWTNNFYVKFATGEQMGAVEKIFLPYPVPPERNVQISINFVAPDSIGSKRSDWKLFNANDVAFYDFYIVVDVVNNGN
jgi:hypothetical protein